MHSKYSKDGNPINYCSDSKLEKYGKDAVNK